MKLNTWVKLTTLAIAAVAMVGCSKPKDDENNVSVDDESSISGAGSYSSFTGGEMTAEEAETLRQQRVFYFAYDSSTLPPEDLRAIEAHAYYLVHHPNARVRVEGHTDSRGSREYNIALGERRAQAVARVLYLAGVENHQVAVVSYGAEKPAVQGMNEEAWRYNRRAEIVYEAE
ncbi:MAG: peptidoglycan-associated lipoprotein Pal [Legionellales bacterium]|jgi:peptidoglycan-associated lipoprotein